MKKKYRLKEVNGLFYPQYRGLFMWHTFKEPEYDDGMDGTIWTDVSFTNHLDGWEFVNNDKRKEYNKLIVDLKDKSRVEAKSHGWTDWQETVFFDIFPFWISWPLSYENKDTFERSREDAISYGFPWVCVYYTIYPA